MHHTERSPYWPFRGTGTEDANDFIERFEAFAKYKKLDDPQMVTTFPLLLRANASTWHNTLTAPADFPALKLLFLAR